MRRPTQEPFHQPIGLSPEEHAQSRRWLWLLIVALLVAVAGVLFLLRLRGYLW